MMDINQSQKPNAYETLYQRKLTDIEVAEAKSNLVGLYGLLLKIDKRIKAEQTNNLMKGANNDQKETRQ